MGHAAPEDLLDLAEVLALVREWPGIRETSPNIFYLKTKPFLHFHVKAGKRWADVRCGADWGPGIEINAPASASARQRFLKTIERSYRETLAATTRRKVER